MMVMNRFILGICVSALVAAPGLSQAASISIPQNTAATAQELAPNGQLTVPLLVVVDARGQVRQIQHSTYLPPAVNDLLWSTIRSWTKKPAKVNGRYEAAQVFMSVVLHAEPAASGQSNVYFTLASNGPVMRGHWWMQNDNLIGYCSYNGDVNRGDGGTTRRCVMKMVPSANGVTSLQPTAQPL